VCFVEPTDGVEFWEPPGTAVAPGPDVGAETVLHGADVLIEPMAWLENIGKTKGKVHCPNRKCHTELGRFDWNGIALTETASTITPGVSLHATKLLRAVR
jgi:dual specificity phosphatase 12